MLQKTFILIYLVMFLHMFTQCWSTRELPFALSTLWVSRLHPFILMLLFMFLQLSLKNITLHVKYLYQNLVHVGKTKITVQKDAKKKRKNLHLLSLHIVKLINQQLEKIHAEYPTAPWSSYQVKWQSINWLQHHVGITSHRKATFSYPTRKYAKKILILPLNKSKKHVHTIVLNSSPHSEQNRLSSFSCSITCAFKLAMRENFLLHSGHRGSSTLWVALCKIKLDWNKKKTQYMLTEC